MLIFADGNLRWVFKILRFKYLEWSTYLSFVYVRRQNSVKMAGETREKADGNHEERERASAKVEQPRDKEELAQSLAQWVSSTGRKIPLVLREK